MSYLVRTRLLTEEEVEDMINWTLFNKELIESIEISSVDLEPDSWILVIRSVEEAAYFFLRWS